MNWKAWIAVAALGLVATGCKGKGSGVAGSFTNYVAKLASTQDDKSEPIDISSVKVDQPDDKEPDTVS